MLKRIYLFVLVLVAGLLVRADVSVQSMALLPTDLTAVQMHRTDLTGALCAVVKVVLPRAGATFEGNVIGEAVFNGSEYHVALTEGSKQLKINVPGSAPIMVTFADYGIPPLQSKTAYQLTLNDISSTYTGTINFSPATATVVVDNRPVQATNGVATVQLPAGSYPYTVSAPGYQTKMGILTIAPSGNNEDDVLLRPDPAAAPVAAATPAPAAAAPAPVANDPYNGHEYVDLGLPSGLKWATCNVGANTPTDYGDYFAWGETKPKNSYTRENSLTYKQEIEAFSGNREYDAATANWGGKWRMPRKEEIAELKKYCKSKWLKVNGVQCRVFISKKNNKELILPAAGGRYGTDSLNQGYVGDYWSASRSSDKWYAWRLYFTHRGSSMEVTPRYHGFPVRPVAE